MQRVPRLLFTSVLLFIITLCLSSQAADQGVFTNSLLNGWENWSWATVNLANTSPVHSAPNSISVSSAGYEALYFHHPAQNGAFYSNVTFWVNGGSAGGQSIGVKATRNQVAQTNQVILAPLPDRKSVV